ncbi:hypothetical protein CONCODRAFT_3860 [Conidiobolus coronatus NRRL 28638]|uniref:Uncharacterized protein n=1 Tax=Conidiobolus coronatus (strain ATCC 28846 / CBS 209.66 / NRRL 28638) TaxID=796925 RepID=A0A137PDW1_CONC2|nr:hypothetical protein CONCODRAFT_3860 [Conidiobolus coronatus NRRL 28638]|eukprot:KXN73193.1 hypothetical protein CONCODRAFT_3860 [Conidiobolus coronatus NRRL 28638]
MLNSVDITFEDDVETGLISNNSNIMEKLAAQDIPSEGTFANFSSEQTASFEPSLLGLGGQKIDGFKVIP